MTKKPPKPKTGPGKRRGLRLKKETIKDLTAGDAAAHGAKGGLIANPKQKPGGTMATYCDTC